VHCVRHRIIEGLATGLYLGKIPFAPGTFGTLLGIPLAWLLARISAPAYLFLTFLLIVAAAAICEMYERFTGRHDPSEVVIDEVVGYLVAAAWLPDTWQAYLAAFIVFRFFDILKPFGIRSIDRRVKGGFGTVLDDVAAGLAANIVLQFVYMKTDWLGEQLVGASFF